jgi:hypothetical protein
MKVSHFYSNFGFPYFGTFRFHVVSKLLVGLLLMLRRSVFTYIYYLLIKKDLRECRNLLVKFPCVSMCLSSGHLLVLS